MMAPLTALNSSFIFSVMLLVNCLVYVMSMPKKTQNYTDLLQLCRFQNSCRIMQFLPNYVKNEIVLQNAWSHNFAGLVCMLSLLTS